MPLNSRDWQDVIIQGHGTARIHPHDGFEHNRDKWGKVECAEVVGGATRWLWPIDAQTSLAAGTITISEPQG